MKLQTIVGLSIIFSTLVGCLPSEKKQVVIKVPEMSLFHIDSEWKDQNSKPFHMKDMSGQVALISMVYTSCEHTCPMIVAKLNAIKKKLPKNQKNKLKFLLFSFDSEGDTPEVLKKYKAKQGLDNNWTLLNANESTIRELAAVIGVNYKKEQDGQFSHSNVISVLGKSGLIVSQIDELNKSTDDLVKAINKELQ